MYKTPFGKSGHIYWLMELIKIPLGNPIYTLKVFTNFHIGVTNIVYKHRLGVKRRVLKTPMWGKLNSLVGSLVYAVFRTPLRVCNKHLFHSVDCFEIEY